MRWFMLNMQLNWMCISSLRSSSGERVKELLSNACFAWDSRQSVHRHPVSGRPPCSLPLHLLSCLEWVQVSFLFVFEECFLHPSHTLCIKEHSGGLFYSLINLTCQLSRMSGVEFTSSCPFIVAAFFSPCPFPPSSPVFHFWLVWASLLRITTMTMHQCRWVFLPGFYHTLLPFCWQWGHEVHAFVWLQKLHIFGFVVLLALVVALSDDTHGQQELLGFWQHVWRLTFSTRGTLRERDDQGTSTQ